MYNLTNSNIIVEKMDKIISLNKKNFKDIPLILMFIFVSFFPIIALTYTNLDSIIFDADSLNQDYFIHTLLQWPLLALTAITTLLAFTQYYLINNKIALILGITFLFSGVIESIHPLIINAISPYIAYTTYIQTIIWSGANISCGIIFIFSLSLLLYDSNKKIIAISNIIIINTILAFLFIIYTTLLFKPSNFLLNHSWINKSFELINLTIYLILILYIYPKAYKKFPNLLTNCILILAIFQILISTYLSLLPNFSFDKMFNIIYLLKIIITFIPFTCLLINYASSYKFILKTQEKLQLTQANLTYLATHDALTNLYNRREFEIQLTKTIANNSREMTSFSLFVIDIDNFKSINDTYGHLIGDNFLKKFAKDLISLTRLGDIVSRTGGDEFTIIMPNLKSPSTINKIAERINKGLNISFLMEQELITCTVSIGIAIYPTDGESLEILLKNADLAMYEAKKSGKNGYVFNHKRKITS